MSNWLSVEFNNRILASAGLAVKYDRNLDQYDPTGVTVAAGTPIYDKKRLLSKPRRTPVTLCTTANVTGTAAQVLCAGTRLNGDTYVVYVLKSTSSNSPNVMVIKTNPTYAANSFDDVTPSAYTPGATATIVASMSSGSSTNLLLESTAGVGGGAAADLVRRYVPFAATCHGDTILVSCSVYDVGAAETRSWALCRWSWTNSQWELLYRQPNYNNGIGRGNAWTRPLINFLDRDPDALTAILTATDYCATTDPKTYSGLTWIAKMQRTSVTADWDIDQIVPHHAIDDLSSLGTGGKHVHCIVATRHGASGVKTLIDDAHNSTGNIRGLFRDDEDVKSGYSGIRTGTTLTRDAGVFGTVDVDPTLSRDVVCNDETDGGVVSGWTHRRYMYGDITQYWHGPNTMTHYPLGTDPDVWLAGSDESQRGLAVHISPTVSTDKFSGRELASYSLNGIEVYYSKFNVWGITSRLPYTDYAAWDFPGSSGTTVNVADSGTIAERACEEVIMYSADGEYWSRWCRPFSSISTSLSPQRYFVVCPDGRVLSQVDNRASGGATTYSIIDFGIPEVEEVRPILTSPSVSQSVKIFAFSGTSGSAVVADVTSTYDDESVISNGQSVPNNPYAAAAVYLFSSAAGAANNVNLWFNGIPAYLEDHPGDVYAVRMWFCSPPPNLDYVAQGGTANGPPNGQQVSTSRWSMYISTATPVSGTRYSGNYDFTPAAYNTWQHRVWYVDKTQAGDFASGPGVITAGRNVIITLEPLKPTSIGANYPRLQMLIGVEVISNGQYVELPSIPSVYTSTVRRGIPATHLTIGCSVPCGTTWQAAFKGMIPAYCWDSYVRDGRRNPARRMILFRQDAGNWVGVKEDTINAALKFIGRKTVPVSQLTVANGGTTATVKSKAHGLVTGMSGYFNNWKDGPTGTGSPGPFTITVADADTFTFTAAANTLQGTTGTLVYCATGVISFYTESNFETSLTAASGERFTFNQLGDIQGVIQQGPSGAMVFGAMVDGTRVNRTTATWTGFSIRPVEIVLGDELVVPICPMAWHRVGINPTGSEDFSTAAAIQTFLESEALLESAGSGAVVHSGFYFVE